MSKPTNQPQANGGISIKIPPTLWPENKQQKDSEKKSS